MICKLTGMIHSCECANNFDENQISFGVAMFAKQEVMSKLRSVQACQFLPVDLSNEWFGSGAVVVVTKDGKALVAVHFPPDAKREGKQNNNGRATNALISVLENYPEDYAFGDMNVILGKTWPWMKEVSEQRGWTLSPMVYSYIGAFYDYAMDNEAQRFVELKEEEIEKILITFSI